MTWQLDTVVCGDCLDVMGGMDDSVVDTIITDPPYGTSFMGRDWDHDVPGPDYWREALRVAKPGAFLLAFGGTRTWHRLACAIEDAGWEIRDTMMWVYGSGFPKSHNISKAIDKAQRREYVQAAIDLGLNIPSSSLYDWTKAEHAPSDKWWQKFKEVLSSGDWQAIERKIIGYGPYHNPKARQNWMPGRGRNQIIESPATEAAALWDGWGTALKPAWEPVLVCMKPLDSTFAANALAHGVAGLWIDGARVATGESLKGGQYSGKERDNGNCYGKHRNLSPAQYQQPQGRWPANVALLHSPDCVRVGTRQIGSGKRKMHADDEVSSAHAGYTRPNKSNYTHKNSSVIASYGEETIDAWQCVPDCPARLLGEQSGESGGKVGMTKHGSGTNNIYGNFTRSAQSFANDGISDTGTAARFFKQIPGETVEQKCVLCNLLLNQKRGTMSETLWRLKQCYVSSAVQSLKENTGTSDSALEVAVQKHLQENGDKSASLPMSAATVIKSLLTTRGIIGSTVLENVLDLLVDKSVLDAKSAASLCDLCTIAIALSLVLIKHERTPALPHCLAFITERKQHHLIQSLVQFAETLDNTDTTITTTTLKMLFGFVPLAIDEFTRQEYLNRTGESAPTRFQYVSKASRTERNEGCEEFYWKRDGKQLVRVDRDEWESLPDRQRARGNIHPTVKPVAMVEYLCKLTRTPTGGVVFDPFIGSGTTAIAAIRTGRPFYGCDNNRDYVDIATARIDHAREKCAQMELDL